MTEEQIKAAFYVWFVAMVGAPIPEESIDKAWATFRTYLYP